MTQTMTLRCPSAPATWRVATRNRCSGRHVMPGHRAQQSPGATPRDPILTRPGASGGTAPQCISLGISILDQEHHHP